MHLPAAAASAYLSWLGAISPTPVANPGFTVYIYMTAYPSAGVRLGSFQKAATLCAGAKVTATGKLQIHDSANLVLATSTGTIPLNALTRVDFEILGISGTTGTVNARMYSGANLETLTADTNGSVSSAGASITGTVDELRPCASAGITLTSAWDCWFDSFAWSDAGAPGPAAVAASAGWGYDYTIGV